MRGLLGVFVVGFTIVSLMLVAAVGVAASSGKAGSSNSLKHSVVALFSGHSEQGSAREGGSSEGEGHHGGNQGDDCKPAKKHHKHATGDHENNQCGHDDSGSG